MSQTTGGLAVVTGASAGIGEATALRLARKGIPVVLIARRVERLESLAERIRSEGGLAYVIPSDLTIESDRVRACATLKELGGVDILVNNAGLGWYGYTHDMPWKVARDIVRVNVEATVHFTLDVLEQMKERNRGHIINIGSISGGLCCQGVALYGATKAFLDSFTTTMYRELRGTNVHVSVIRAGAVASEFYTATDSTSLRFPTATSGMKPEVVADRVYALIRHPKRVTFLPFYLRFVPWLEMSFAWLIDLIGPFLLRWEQRKLHHQAQLEATPSRR